MRQELTSVIDSMNYKLQYSKESLRDLDRIYDYVEIELVNPEAAIRIVEAIFDRLEQLCQYPFMGAQLSSIANIESDYRFLTSGNYIAFYRVEGTFVYVDRILSSRSDYLRVLLGKEA